MPTYMNICKLKIYFDLAIGNINFLTDDFWQGPWASPGSPLDLINPLLHLFLTAAAHPLVLHLTRDCLV